MFNLNMLRLQFTLEALEPISLPIYKGSTFHGGFGHALETISPTWFRYFFQTDKQTSNTLPKPFVLLPPLDTQQSYHPGETFHCELTLFGEAVQHYAIAHAAIEYLGNVMGLGYSRGKFKIQNINTPSFNSIPAQADQLTLTVNTRLRLKANNRLLKQAPEFSQLIKSLFTRLKTLQHCYTSTPIDESLYQQLLRQSHAIQQTQSKMHWDDWDRYSGTQNEWMKFGGLLGESSYQGDLHAFIPYLQRGEWTHIGGKSSFGLGKYTLDYGEHNGKTSS